MLRQTVIAVALTALTGCGQHTPEPASATEAKAPTVSPSPDNLPETLGHYQSAAQALVEALDSGADPLLQRDALLHLYQMADAGIEDFTLRYPACALYVAAAATLADRWQSLSVTEIERNYHQDGVLPPIADPDQHALCYQMKDLLVHPLTALRMLDEEPVDLRAVRDEIVEVVAHAAALRILTSGK